MTKDKELEAFFASHKLQADDGREFMAALNHKLNAVEYIKQYQRAKMRRYRVTMLITLVVGLVCGGAVMAYLQLVPIDEILVSMEMPSLDPTIASLWRTVSVVALSGLIGYGVVSFVMLVDKIRN